MRKLIPLIIACLIGAAVPTAASAQLGELLGSALNVLGTSSLATSGSSSASLGGSAAPSGMRVDFTNAREQTVPLELLPPLQNVAVIVRDADDADFARLLGTHFKVTEVKTTKDPQVACGPGLDMVFVTELSGGDHRFESRHHWHTVINGVDCKTRQVYTMPATINMPSGNTLSPAVVGYYDETIAKRIMEAAGASRQASTQ